MPSCLLSASPICCQRRLVARLGQLDREQQRRVEAGAEALLEQVVGDPRGVVLLVGAGVARRQAHVQRGQRERDQHGERERSRRAAGGARRSRSSARRSRSRVGRSPPSPFGRLDRGRRSCSSIAGISVSAATIVASTAQRGADRRPVEERDAEQHHAEHRDHDDDAREQHGAAGRVERDQRRLAHVAPGAALEPEAVEDQQRVVDADADADHRRQLRRPVDDVEHAGADDGRQRRGSRPSRTGR